MSSNLYTFDSDITTMEQAVGLSRMNGGQIELKQSSSGMIARSFANYCEILEKDPYLSGKSRMNVFNKRVTLKDVYWHPEEHTLCDNDISNLRRFIDCAYGVSPGKDIKDEHPSSI